MVLPYFHLSKHSMEDSMNEDIKYETLIYQNYIRIFTSLKQYLPSMHDEIYRGYLFVLSGYGIYLNKK